MTYAQFCRELDKVYRAYLQDLAAPLNFRAAEQGLLFPEIELSKPVKNGSQVATITGSLFEVITGALTGAHRIRSTDSDEFLPDLWNAGCLLESKVGQKWRYMKVKTEQLEWYAGLGFPVVYYLWSYVGVRPDGRTALFRECDTVKELLELVIGTVDSVIILPGKLLHTIGQLEPEGVRRREYESWNNYKCLHFSRPFLRSLVADPVKLLVDLGLNPWGFEARRRTAEVRFLYLGREWRTNRFSVFEIREVI